MAALVVDVGQQDDLEEMRARAIGCGAVRAHVLDRCEAFVRDVILPATAAPAPPDGDARRLAHPVIAAALLEVAAIEGAGAVARVRRRIARCTYPRLDPAMPVIVPAGEWMPDTRTRRRPSPDAAPRIHGGGAGACHDRVSRARACVGERRADGSCAS